MNYFKKLEFLGQIMNIKQLSVGLLIFALLWAFLGVLMTIITRFYVVGWKKYEEDFPNREKIFRDFENLHLGGTANPKKLDQMRKELEYFLIRQEFISPTFLPVVGEDFLRDDFDFAQYLGGCMAKTSAEAFRYEISSVFTIALCVGLYLLLSHQIPGNKVRPRLCSRLTSD